MRPGWPLKGLYPKKHSWLCSRGQVLPSSPPNALLLAIKAIFWKIKTHREKIEGESVGRFPPGFVFKKTDEAQDPAACGTALAALPAPAGGYSIIPSCWFISKIFWPKKGGFMVEIVVFPWFFMVEIVVFPGFPQPRGRQILRADVAAVGELNVGKQRWSEKKLASVSVAWHLKCIMQYTLQLLYTIVRIICPIYWDL